MFHGTQRTRRDRTQEKRTHRTATGVELTVIAAEADRDTRASLSLLVNELPQRPEPSDTVRDVERGRPASIQRFRLAEAAVVRHSTADAILRYCTREWMRLRKLANLEPMTWEDTVPAEIDAECEANKHQLRLREYYERGDRVGVQRFNEAQATHAWHAKQLLEYGLYLAQQMDAKRPARPLQLVPRGHAS